VARKNNRGYMPVEVSEEKIAVSTTTDVAVEKPAPKKRAPKKVKAPDTGAPKEKKPRAKKAKTTEAKMDETTPVEVVIPKVAAPEAKIPEPKVVVSANEKSTIKAVDFKAVEEAKKLHEEYDKLEGYKKVESLLVNFKTPAAVKAFIWNFASRISANIEPIVAAAAKHEKKPPYCPIAHKLITNGAQVYRIPEFSSFAVSKEGYEAIVEFTVKSRMFLENVRAQRQTEKLKFTAGNILVNKATIEKLRRAGLIK